MVSARVHRIPPMVGRLRRQIVFDITMFLGIGTLGGYGYWYGYHIPALKVRDEYYLKIDREKSAQRLSAVSSYVADGN